MISYHGPYWMTRHASISLPHTSHENVPSDLQGGANPLPICQVFNSYSIGTSNGEEKCLSTDINPAPAENIPLYIDSGSDDVDNVVGEGESFIFIPDPIHWPESAPTLDVEMDDEHSSQCNVGVKETMMGFGALQKSRKRTRSPSPDRKGTAGRRPE